MNTKISHILLVLSTFVGGLVVVLGILLYATGQFGAGASGSSTIGGPFKLIDQNGKPVTEASLKGKPTLVYFGYTHCPDTCPTTLFELSEVLRAMGKDAGRANALFVTIDPERDTPAVLKDYLSAFDPHLIGATGSHQAVAAIEKEYRVYSKKVPTENGDYGMDHTSLIYLMDKDGRFVAPFNLNRKPEASAAALRKYL